ncbi:hypothetical protein ABLG96_17820 [Nakamurella sp. A5-74]|uniref:DUF998 domain-containing protein n=1 Tax=Nakamurella sp. A5-74 TaxID=3158264 RepID=A0AAU8DLB8_9ACTN
MRGRAGSWRAPSVGLTAAVVCAVAAVIAWTDAHVTYALPNGVGHDVLGGGIAAAAVCAISALCSLGAALFALRSPRSARTCLIVALVALVISLGALALFEVGPSKTY